MGATLTQQRRVRDDGLRVVNRFQQGRTLTVPAEEAPANYVPAAAVIRRGRALSGMIGRKARAGGRSSGTSNPGAQPRAGSRTGRLECGRGERNSKCSGEMRRYLEEHRWRRQLSGPSLTLRRESRGSNRIRYPGSPGRKRWALGVGGHSLRAAANALSAPPGEYGGNAKTQRN